MTWEKETLARRSKGEGEKTWRRGEGRHKMRSKVLDRASKEVQTS